MAGNCSVFFLQKPNLGTPDMCFLLFTLELLWKTLFLVCCLITFRQEILLGCAKEKEVIDQSKNSTKHNSSSLKGAGKYKRKRAACELPHLCKTQMFFPVFHPVQHVTNTSLGICWEQQTPEQKTLSAALCVRHASGWDPFDYSLYHSNRESCLSSVWDPNPGHHLLLGCGISFLSHSC